MTRLAFPDYLSAIRTESAGFRAALAGCDPSARVPACPDWDAGDLLWHLTEVQWFWGTRIRDRPAAPEERDIGRARPDSWAGLLEAFDGYSAELVRQLEDADPAEAAWTWAPEQTVGFTFRRQAHEALIHRLDAEQTAGLATTPLDPALAADGVDEMLDVMFGGKPAWGAFAPLDHHVAVVLPDAGTRIVVQLGLFSGSDPDGDRAYVDEPDILVVPDPGTEPDAVITGDAGVVDAWLWQRGDDAGVRVTGDRDVYDRLRLVISEPVD